MIDIELLSVISRWHHRDRRSIREISPNTGLGGVPQRGIYDNMRTAVAKVGRGKEHQVNIRFSAMVSLQIYPDRFVVVAEGQAICEHQRVFARSHDHGAQGQRRTYDTLRRARVARHAL